ncbi:MAG: hypothetical protein ACTHW5_11225 [Microbacterium sp.]
MHPPTDEEQRATRTWTRENASTYKWGYVAVKLDVPLPIVIIVLLAVDVGPPADWNGCSKSERYGARRWYTTGEEVSARLEANPPTEEDLRVAAEWLTEYNARPHDDADAWEDPWERADRQRELGRRRGTSA